MANKDDFDFGKLLDDFIDGAKKVGENIMDKSSEFVKDSGLQDLKDYYPFYAWPPLNLYTSEDKSLIFEFGLPGFLKDDIKIGFEEDYMIFSALLSNKYSTGGSNRYFKKKCKLEDIVDQKYYLPQAEYDRENYTMNMKSGLLRLVFPALEE